MKKSEEFLREYLFLDRQLKKLEAELLEVVKRIRTTTAAREFALVQYYAALEAETKEGK